MSKPALRYIKIKCSKCGTIIETDSPVHKCPNCGAILRSKKCKEYINDRPNLFL